MSEGDTPHLDRRRIIETLCSGDGTLTFIRHKTFTNTPESIASRLQSLS